MAIELHGEMDKWKGVTEMMIEKVLKEEANQLPEGKSIKNFGGGYVECLKTKAKVVLYFGFDEARNRCQIVLDVDKEDVLLWQQAIAERIWNRTKSTPKYSFRGEVNSHVDIIIPEDLTPIDYED